MVDFFAILMLPNAGDELQGIKRGILELADLIIVNKADGQTANLAKAAVQQYTGAVELLTSISLWKPKVVSTSSVEKIGIDTVYNLIKEYRTTPAIAGSFKTKRAEQNKDWFQKLIHELIDLKMNSKQEYKKKKQELENEVVSEKKFALSAAQEYVDQIFK
jgi:LAO/AO transport system kinase